TAIDEARAAFARQAAGLLAGGVDGFILETFADLNEIRAAIAGVRSVSDLPVVAQMTVGDDGGTACGSAPEAFGPGRGGGVSGGAEGVGVNARVGPRGRPGLADPLHGASSKPISAQPNAGLPRQVADRKIYMASPEYMAEYARRIVEAGARFVGGCCGTTPEH